MPGPYYNPMLPDPRIMTSLGMPSSPQAQAQMQKQKQHFGLWDKIQEMVAPYPTSLKGQVSEGDVKGMRNQGLLAAGAAMLQGSGPSTQRTSFGQLAGAGVQAGMGAYNNAVDRKTQQLAAQQGMAANKQGMEATKQSMDFNAMKMDAFKAEQAKMAQLSAGRRDLIAKLGPPDTSDPQGTAKWIDAAIPELMQAGDDDMVGRLSEIRKSIGGGSNQQSWVEVDKGDAIERRDKATGQVLEVIKKGAAPRDTGAGIEQREALGFQRDFQRANMLSDNFRNETKLIAQAANQYRTVTQIKDSAKAGDPAAQISLIFAYMKSLDPSSVVRESEYATAQNAAGIPEKIRNQYNKALDGNFLTPQQVDQFVGAAKKAAQGWKRQQDNFTKEYGQRAKRWKLDEQDVVLDYFDGLDMKEPDMSKYNFGGSRK